MGRPDAAVGRTVTRAPCSGAQLADHSGTNPRSRRWHGPAGRVPEPRLHSVRHCHVHAWLRPPPPSCRFRRPNVGDATKSTRSSPTLESGWLTTGPRVRRFEAEFAAYTGAPHAVARELVHGGAAPVAARGRRRAGRRSDHDAADVLRDGQRHRARRRHAGLCRHRSRRRGISIRRRLPTAMTPRTRALLPVHYAGRPVDLEAFERLARAARAGAHRGRGALRRRRRSAAARSARSPTSPASASTPPRT